VKKEKGQIRRKGSAAGFHFVNLYQCCPRKWYFRFLKGWSPKMTAKPLILGSAFHEGKAEWYKGKSLKVCLNTALAIVEEAKPELLEEDYLDISYRLPCFLSAWVETYGKMDRQEFKPLAVEKEYSVPLGQSGYFMTIRPDAILQSKVQTDLVIIMETKTTGFSHRVTSEAVYYGDQATAYTWGARKVGKIPVYAVQPDIAYWNKMTRDPNNIKMVRTDLVFRDEARCLNFEKGMTQLFVEMSQKAEAYRKGWDPWVLFPRNSHYCLSFSTPCEFAEICGQDCEKRRVPSGFRKVGGVRKIGGYVEDSIAVD